MSLLSRLRARPVRPAPEVGKADLAPERAAQPSREPVTPAVPVAIEREHLGGGRYRVRMPIEELVAQRRGGRAPVGFSAKLGAGDPHARAARHLGYGQGEVLWPGDAR